MDSQVRNFLMEEKASNIDYSHKCVATKFGKWLLQRRLEKDPAKKVTPSRRQFNAIRGYK